ncbi:hypothetical protein GCM10022214_27090 [Actinomadura miaoliensis]|uniref:Uncharacterized protein n=1 Tax=Actinomadura miaoliensis TaxID=430685 RepID=A0ABP7VLY5_9ACTN
MGRSGRVDGAARARLARLAVGDPVSRRSEFDQLKDTAKAASLGSRSLGKLKERLASLADIEAIGPTSRGPAAVTGRCPRARCPRKGLLSCVA